MTYREDMTLAEARTKLFEIADKRGTHCPCCHKHVKVYRRSINCDMARVLIYTYPVFRDNPGKWLDVKNYLTRHFGYGPGDYGKLVWWGLFEKRPDHKREKLKANRYRMTEKGKDFVLGNIVVPSHAIEYQSNVEAFVGDAVDIRWALGKDFDYAELMQAAAGARA